MRAILILLLLSTPALTQGGLGGRSGGGGTANRITSGNGAPSGANCASVNDVGKIYARRDAKAANASQYTCAQTGDGVFSWELPGGNAGTGTVTNTGGALTLNQPMFGAGVGDSKVGTKTGNTNNVATAVAGAKTTGNIPQWDANDNLTDGMSVATSVGSPGVDTQLVTEKGIRSAITAAIAALTKASVGLGNVDNTSDANKPVSTATQTALDLKAPATSGTSPLKGNGAGGFAATTASDIAGLFSGSGDYLKKDGSSGTPAGGSGIVNLTTGAGVPLAACTAPSASNLSYYVDTGTSDLWRCSATNTWKRILDADATGTGTLTFAEGDCSAVTKPSAGDQILCFDSTTHHMNRITSATVVDIEGAVGGGDVIGPATNTANYLPQWNGSNSKTLKDGLAVSQTATASAVVQRNASGEVIAANTVATGKTPMATDTGVQASQMPAMTGDATSSAGAVALTLATKYKTQRVLGYELPGTGTAGVLQAADFTAAFAAGINNGDAKTLTAAYCMSDTGDQTVVVSVGGSARFTIHCVASASFSTATTDGTTGYIIAASMTNTAIAAHAVMDVTGTANGSTKDLKIFAYGTVN